MRVRTISQKTRPECSEVTGVRSTRTVFQDRESDDAVSAYYGRIHWISADDSVAGWGGFDSTTGKAGAWKVTTGGDFYRQSSTLVARTLYLHIAKKTYVRLRADISFEERKI